VDLVAILEQAGVQPEIHLRTPEDEKEREHRHRLEVAKAEHEQAEAAKKADHERRKDFWTFVVMALSVGAVLFFLAAGSFLGFFLAFMVLFLTTGIGNGSTYRMIHSVFRTERVREAVHRGEGARTEAAPRPEGGFLWDRLRGRYRNLRGLLGFTSLQVLDLHVR
jgi:hypothetical protein